jgi:phosphotriesterase-related protein
MNTGNLRTVNGDVLTSTLGIILPHEHLFTDLRGPTTPGYAQGDPQTVSPIMLPYLQAAQAAGVTALVECSTGGVGRNVAVLRHLASLTPIQIVAPTGVYKESFTPPPLLDLSVEALADLWIRDLTEGMEGTSVRAGFIKIAMSDDGPLPSEVRNLKAAAVASRTTGAVIASHTIGGARPAGIGAGTAGSGLCQQHPAFPRCGLVRSRSAGWTAQAAGYSRLYGAV